MTLAEDHSASDGELQFDSATESLDIANGNEKRRRMVMAAMEGDDSSDGSDMETNARPSKPQAREYNPNKKISTGSFTSMNLIPSLFKAIQRKGYHQPTPIQRKSIGPLLEGRDVVGMARTGSGKTAAFIIPMVQKLKTHSVKVGVRGLVMVPTRELALQIMQFTKLMAKFTDLRTCMIVGGDSFEEQFMQLATNPDIIIATPGRLLHLCIEAQLSLQMVEMAVFDEADRLFELGFAEQLNELLARMPSTRQTALFSATLPQGLVEFAAAGLVSPVFVRLDSESKLSADLKCSFLAVQTSRKDAALLFLLRTLIKPGELTLIFAATRHHVEYLQTLLRACDYHVGYVYGSMDQEAREQAVANFRTGRWSILIVTDVAARGIDIPLLANVINYDFPGKAKLFVHRVGRVARAGRTGTAYSLIAPDEIPFLVDLQMFLGGQLQISNLDTVVGPEENYTHLLGSIPTDWLDGDEEMVNAKVAVVPFLEDLRKVAANAYKLYYKTRPTATPDSYTATKKIVSQLAAGTIGAIHPILKDLGMRPGCANTSTKIRSIEESKLQAEMISAIRSFKPLKAHASGVVGLPRLPKKMTVNDASPAALPQEKSSAVNENKYKDDDFYLPYARSRSDYKAAEERGYSVKESFMAQASSAVLDMAGNSDDLRRSKLSGIKDRRKRDTAANQKFIKTENGTRIPASYGSQDMYKRWMKKTHLALPMTGDTELAKDRVDALAPKKRWVTKSKSPPSKAKQPTKRR